MGRRGCDPNFLGYIVLLSSDRTKVLREAEIKGRGRKLTQILNKKSKVYLDHEEELNVDVKFDILNICQGENAKSVSSPSILESKESQQTNITSFADQTSQQAIIAPNTNINIYSEVDNELKKEENMEAAPENCYLDDDTSFSIEEAGNFFFFDQTSSSGKDEDLPENFYCS